MRLQLISQLESRDGTEAKDGLMTNCFAEKSGNKTYVKKRFGTSVFSSSPAGTGQGMFTLLGEDYAIIGDILYNISTAPTVGIYPFTAIGTQYQCQVSDDGLSVFIKTDNYAYIFSSVAIATITAPIVTGTNTVTYASTGMPFSVGDTVVGQGIPSGTTITVISQTGGNMTGFTMSNVPTTSSPTAQLTIGYPYAVNPMPANGTLTGISITNAGNNGTPIITMSWTAGATSIASSTFTPEIIAYGNGTYLAFGSATSPTQYAYSANGTSWAPVTLGAAGNPPVGNYSALAYGNGVFLLINLSGYNTYTSPTGLNGSWTTHTGALPTTTPGQNPTGNWNGVAYGSNVFVTINTNTWGVYTSVDGIVWVYHTANVYVTTNGGSYTYDFHAICWPTAITFNNSKFIIYGAVNTNSIETLNSAYPHIVGVCTDSATSTDGTTWSYPPNTSVAGWNNGSFAPQYSSTRINALEIAASSYKSYGTTNTANGPVSGIGGGTYVALASGSSNQVAVSPDGLTWTAYTLPSTSTWCVHSDGTVIYAANINGGTYVSFNGIVWQPTTISPTTDLWTAIGGNGSQIVMLDNSTTIQSAYSSGPIVNQNAFSLTFLGGNGSQATGTYTIGLDGTVQNATITGGINYTISPAAQFSDGGVIGATAVIYINAYPARTVPGVAYLDGSYYVVDSSNNTVVGSNIEKPTIFQSLNTIIANSVSGTAKWIGRYLTYVVVLKSASMEVFYDAANAAPVSPLGTVPSALSKIGCVDGHTVVSFDNEVVWVSQSSEKGLQVVQMSGLQTKPVSTSDIDLILNMGYIGGSHVTYAFSIKIQGHNFYVLTMVSANLTLIYDLTSGLWYNWTMSSSYLPFSSYQNDTVNDLLLHSSSGIVYSANPSLYQDNLSPIEVHIRTDKWDGGNTDTKFFSRVEVVGDKTTTTVNIRYSDDDYQTWSNYRPVDLSIVHSKITRAGKAIRRAFEIEHIDNTPLRLEALDLDVE